MARPPLAEKGLAALRDLFGRGGVDHVGEVSRDLLMEPLRRVGQQVSVLVDRAALDRHAVPDGGERLFETWCAIDNEEKRPAQASADKVVEHGPPRLSRLSPHVPD